MRGRRVNPVDEKDATTASAWNMKAEKDDRTEEPLSLSPEVRRENPIRQAMPASREQAERPVQLHGGRAGAPFGKRNGRWRHGNESMEAKAQRRAVRALLRQAAKLLQERQPVKI